MLYKKQKKKNKKKEKQTLMVTQRTQHLKRLKGSEVWRKNVERYLKVMITRAIFYLGAILKFTFCSEHFIIFFIVISLDRNWSAIYPSSLH